MGKLAQSIRNDTNLEPRVLSMSRFWTEEAVLVPGLPSHQSSGFVMKRWVGSKNFVGVGWGGVLTLRQETDWF